MSPQIIPTLQDSQLSFHNWKPFAVTGLLSCLPWVLTLLFEAGLKVVQRLGLLRLLPQEVQSLLPVK